MLLRIKEFINRLKNRRINLTSKMSLTLIFIITTISIFTIILLGLIPKKIDVKVGELAPIKIQANKDIIDNFETDKLKMEAKENVTPEYRVDMSIPVKIKADIGKFFEELRALQEDMEKSEETKVESLKAQNLIQLEDIEYSALLNSSYEENIYLERNIYENINSIMDRGVTEKELKHMTDNEGNYIENTQDIPERLIEVEANIIQSKILVNKIIDLDATDKKKEEAADKVEPVIIKEGEQIVDKNQIVDKQIYMILEKADLLKNRGELDIRLVVGALIMTLVFEMAIGLYFYFFERETLRDRKKIIVIIMIFLSTIIISKNLYGISGYLMPVATAAILLSILMNVRIALVVNIFTAILLTITTGMGTSIIVMTLISGVIGVLVSINIQQRANIMTIGVVVSLFNILTIVSFGIVNSLDVRIIALRSLYGFISGTISSILALGSMPIWENRFGMLTPMKLLELMNPNQAIIKKLLLEAPGTYYHSIIVGNLSESACEEIGANALLARVASYYHDVGKTKNPFLFKENQVNMKNPHDEMDPEISARIITSHTIDGYKMAEEYHIPKEIKDIIVEHHGTTLVSYFYYEDLKQKGGDKEKIDENIYRYKGFKPKSKESGIIMLADSVEAATRSIKNPDSEKIGELIQKIVTSKIEDGQLDECKLTFNDIRKIKESFVNTLLRIYHERIEYPDMEEDLKNIK